MVSPGLAHKGAEFPGGGRPCRGHRRTRGAATRQEAPAALRPPGPSAGGWENLVTRSPSPTSVPQRRGRGPGEGRHPGTGAAAGRRGGRGARGRAGSRKPRAGGRTEWQGLRGGSARACTEEKNLRQELPTQGEGAGEKEAGRDLHCLCNFQNTPFRR